MDRGRQRHLGQRARPPPTWYAGAYKLKVAAEIANNATGIGFDASDLMPAAVGAGTFWTKTVEWVNNGGANTDAILKAIDDSWPASNDLMACGAPHLTVGRPATRLRGGGVGWPCKLDPSVPDSRASSCPSPG